MDQYRPPHGLVKQQHVDTVLQRILLPGDHAQRGHVSLLLESTGGATADFRERMVLPAGHTVSFCSYLNAFPAGYWARWSILDRVRLSLEVVGNAVVRVYRSSADGEAEVAEEVRHQGQGDVDIELPLTGFDDGGWYWFELSPQKQRNVELLRGSWNALTPAPGRAAAVVGMPTFNRPQDCLATMRVVAGHPALRAVVKRLVVVDQGSDKVTAQPGYQRLADDFGEQLLVVDQPNLGGSGGYAQVMRRALDVPECEQIVFMDDDIVLEPDCLLRGIAFARYAAHPLLVGGQMLNRELPSQLYVMGELIDRRAFTWLKPSHSEYDHDFSTRPLRETPWLHRRIDVSYNSWWTCVIPRTVAEKVGGPLPLFLKWDDVEYGLRSASRGFPTVSVPGIAVWHEPWWKKDEENNWQTYFHSRNRMVAAALHGRLPHFPALFGAHLRDTLRHLVSMQYWNVALRGAGVRDFLQGPDALSSSLPTARQRAARAFERFAPVTGPVEVTETPLGDGAGDLPRQVAQPPGTSGASMFRLLVELVRGCLPVSGGHAGHGHPRLSTDQAAWHVLAALGGAAVTSPDGSHWTLRERRPDVFRKLLAETLISHGRLALAFPRTRSKYRRNRQRLESLRRPSIRKSV
ncbi:glycosyltransferase [Streptomyces sp. MP131-18]|uniref:glycosyltransferase n=1 Tax=Streptomyces sp. MP131-18 TaxID=1857892 RepID=UPI00097CAD4E|nr:glycosyltransferase [Streptomyces sp. MP131-18]ONK10473.1 Galactofuranosyl transferase GlfT2 [Streptomyces sp. MP131-18]